MSLASTLYGYNNVGAITVTGPNNYPGQTGVYKAPNGLNFGIFDSQESGQNAVFSWLQNNTGTDPNNSYTTVGEAGNAYTGGSGGVNWAHILGVDPNTPISSLSLNSIAGAAIQNEGIVKAGGSTMNATSPSGSSNPLTAISNFFSTINSQSFATRIALVVIGVILIAAAVFALTGGPKFVVEAAKTAAIAA